MKISAVQVTYGELRSSGFPEFSNKRVEVTLSATLEQGDTAEQVKEKLYSHAREAVICKFSEQKRQGNDMDIPF